MRTASRVKARAASVPREGEPARRHRFPLSLALSVLTFCGAAEADVIYLNNGNVLVVEKAWEEGTEVKYRTTQGVLGLPKSSVRRIQEQKETPAAEKSARSYGIAIEENSRPMPTPPLSSNPTSTGPKSITREGLARLRDNVRADPADADAKAELVQALNSLASLQLVQGDHSLAKNSLEEALTLDKRNPVLLSNLAITHFRLGNYRVAEDLLLTCLEAGRKDQSTHYLLGEAYYAQDKIAQAISQWTAALQLGPDPNISKRLEKARQEAGTHNELGVLQSAHFILRYDRKVSDYRLGQQILTVLEGLYRRLSSELSSRPPATIAVILYPDQTYFDITQAPGWTGALFDGKIRVPTQGLDSVTPELTATLAHELTHSFVASLSGRGCPAWFNEGVAQLQEGKSASSHRKWLAQLQRENQLIPLKNLRGSLVGLSSEAAGLAYLEGLSAVEHLVFRFGKTAIRRVLDLMGQNYNFENAFQTALGQTPADFEISWQQSLAQ